MKLKQMLFIPTALVLANASQAQVQDTTTNYAYDEVGRVTQVTDPLARVTKHEYDAQGRKTKTTDAKNGITQFAYDGLSQLTKVTDARNLATSYTIDGLGNLIQTSSPDTGNTVNTYDEAGNLTTRTDAKNQTTTYKYDALDRVTSVTYADGTSATYTYDQGAYALGHLSQIADVSGTTQYRYDQRGRMASETRTIGGQAYTTAYRYDQYGRLSGMTYPSGRSVDYVRDEAGRIKEIRTTKDGASALLISQVSYQPFGALQSLVFGNGQTYSRSYDLNGRMTSYTLNGQVQTLTYDAASRITGVADGGNAANNRSYGYDQLDRITSEQRAQRSLGYSYDAVGNRTQYVNGAAVTNYTYGTTSNRLTQLAGSQNTSIATDANGSITHNGNVGFNYDARGRMVSANTAIGLVRYNINALGQRVLKTTPTASTIYHYDQSGNLIAESTGGVLTEYVYVGDIPIAVIGAAALSVGEVATYFIHTDQLNTPRVITNVDGVRVWQWDSDPFGKDAASEQLAGQAALEFNQRFPGQQYDRENNLHYNYFRVYDPLQGRYIESDPIGLEAGVNTYSYVLNRPLTEVDPLGLANGAAANMRPCRCDQVLPNAINLIGDRRYSKASSFGFGSGKNKCNLLVDHAAAGMGPRRYAGFGGPIPAGDWGTRGKKIPGWEEVDDPLPGDVVAVAAPSGNTSGHVGIVEVPGVSTISANGEVGVRRASWPWNSNEASGMAVYRRCTCKR